MTEHSQQKRRSDKTQRKTVYLTEFGLTKIQQWADDNQLNFSASIETLALLALNDERADFIIPAVRATTLQGLQLVFNRLARLLTDIAYESAVTRTLAEGLFLQNIRQEATQYPDDFQQRMRIQRNGRQQHDSQIRLFHNEVKEAAERSARRRLTQAVHDLDQLLHTPEASEEQAS